MGFFDALQAATDPAGGGLFGTLSGFLGGLGDTFDQVSGITSDFNSLFGGQATIDLGGSFGTIAPQFQPFVAFPGGLPIGVVAPGQGTDSGAFKVFPIIIGGLVVFFLTRR